MRCGILEQEKIGNAKPRKSAVQLMAPFQGLFHSSDNCTMVTYNANVNIREKLGGPQLPLRRWKAENRWERQKPMRPEPNRPG